MRVYQVVSVAIASLGNLPLANNTVSFASNGVTREHKPGERAVDGGFMETNTPAMLELSVNQTSAVNPETLNNITDENVTITMSNGDTWVMQNAWNMEPPAIKSEGVMELKFCSNLSEKL